MNTTFRF